MLYSISQNAKLVLLERVKQEITSKVIVVDIAKKRKRKRETTTTTTTTCGGDGTQKEITSTANTNDNGAPDACPLSDTFAKTIIRSRLIVGECIEILFSHRSRSLQDIAYCFGWSRFPRSACSLLMTITNWHRG